MKPQNTTHAVMSQRLDRTTAALDDFPTPPWGTRALIEHVIKMRFSSPLDRMTCLEPACGRGHMATTLKEYFKEVTACDIHNYGYGGCSAIAPFLTTVWPAGHFDWVITNPPFKAAEDFILKALPIARVGVAMLVRPMFLESVGRYERLFTRYPPTAYAQFVERIPMVKGRVDNKVSSATAYGWLVWEKGYTCAPALMWIPPCRKELELRSDYF